MRALWEGNGGEMGETVGIYLCKTANNLKSICIVLVTFPLVDLFSLGKKIK